MDDEWKGCFYCEFFVNKGVKCKAYPKGIPLPIISGDKPHTEVFRGQTGEYTYKKKGK